MQGRRGAGLGQTQQRGAVVDRRVTSDAERDRVLDGLFVAATKDSEPKTMECAVAHVARRWVVVRNAHATEAGPILVKPRNTWSMMRGPHRDGRVLSPGVRDGWQGAGLESTRAAYVQPRGSVSGATAHSSGSPGFVGILRRT